MACMLSEMQKAEKLRNAEIEKMLKREKVALKQEIKLLLLGAGQSGKSTIVKQMRIIHGGGYSEKDKEEYIQLCKSNTVNNTIIVLESIETLAGEDGFDLTDEESGHADVVFEWEGQPTDYDDFGGKFGPAIKALAAAGAVDKLLTERRNDFQIEDSTEYYFGEIDRLMDSAFVPNNQDILRSRVATTGIVEFKFDLDKTIFRMIDVGGQRSERRKWIHCFEDVTSITFLVSSSGYNQLCVEDGVTNRMVESLALWQTIINYEWFMKASMILFLNKTDLLEMKVEKYYMGDWFPDFVPFDEEKKSSMGGNYTILRSVQEYQEMMYKDLVEVDEGEDPRQVYSHFTTATDTKLMKVVFESVKDTILQENLKAYAVV